MKNPKVVKILVLLLPIQWLIVKIISYYPQQVETYYSNGLYQKISELSRFTFKWVPFSIGDFIYICIILYSLKQLIYAIKRKQFRFMPLIVSLSIIYFVFHFTWGLNYYRLPLKTQFEIQNTQYETNEIEALTYQLVKKTNELHCKLTGNDTLAFTNNTSRKEIYKSVSDAYGKLSIHHPALSYKNATIKNSLLSKPLTYMGFAGYLNPFTSEAQVNSMIPNYITPIVSCHEAAHQIGYAAENEANFIGFLAAISSNDLTFQYSGYYFALRYALIDLYYHDEEKYNKVKATVNIGILKNMKENQEFWRRYQNPLEAPIKSVYDLFLKANKQEDGIKSYNTMIGLLINYNQQENSLLKQQLN